MFFGRFPSACEGQTKRTPTGVDPRGFPLSTSLIYPRSTFSQFIGLVVLGFGPEFLLHQTGKVHLIVRPDHKVERKLILGSTILSELVGEPLG